MTHWLILNKILGTGDSAGEQAQKSVGKLSLIKNISDCCLRKKIAKGKEANLGY